MAKESAAALKVRKKKWFTILAPSLFREVVVGEMPLYESEQMKGRGLTVNMMTLTNNPKSQSVSVQLRITDVRENKGVTQLMGFDMNTGSLKRFVRRGKTKVDDSFVIITSDRKLVRIKPVLVTNTLASRAVVALIRRIVRNNVAKLAQKYTYDKLLEEIIGFRLQKHIIGLSSKVTPVRTCEIRALQLVERPGVKPIVPREDDMLPAKEEEYVEMDEEEGTPQTESTERFESQADQLETSEEEVQ